jgi:hypothetical protein
VDVLLTLLLVIMGLLLLLLSLAGVVFGVFMALDERTREQGVFFAVWWVPAVAASLGIVLRDRVTFTVGILCFVVAGAALALERHSSNTQAKVRRTDTGTPSRPPLKKGSSYENAKRRLSKKLKEYRKVTS